MYATCCLAARSFAGSLSPCIRSLTVPVVSVPWGSSLIPLGEDEHHTRSRNPCSHDVSIGLSISPDLSHQSKLRRGEAAIPPPKWRIGLSTLLALGRFGCRLCRLVCCLAHSCRLPSLLGVGFSFLIYTRLASSPHVVASQRVQAYVYS